MTALTVTVFGKLRRSTKAAWKPGPALSRLI